MPGELERLIIAILSPKPAGDQKGATAAVLQYDQLKLISDVGTGLGVTVDYAPSNRWGTARWGEAQWG